MQLNSSYLYPNKMDVYTNLGSWTTERYRNVYQRTFKTYRGVDNRLDLQVRNSDQKPKNISGYSVVFNLIGTESKELILSKDCIIHDALTGKVYVVLTQADMEPLLHGSYYFSAYTQAADGTRTPLYSDTQYDVVGRVDVVADAYGGPVPTLEITNTSYVVTPPYILPFIDTYNTDAIDAKPQFNSNEALHTMAFYATDFTGTIVVEGSLDTSPTNWVEVSKNDYTGLTLDYLNVTGVWSWLRIKHQKTSGTLDKVLYRY